MGVHEWSYDNDISQAKRFLVPHADQSISLKDLKVEVELGFDDKMAFEEAQRCLNCDVQTVFTEDLCIECDACEDICPTDCINFIDNSNEEDLRNNFRVPALNLDQDLDQQVFSSNLLLQHNIPFQHLLLSCLVGQ